MSPTPRRVRTPTTTKTRCWMWCQRSKTSPSSSKLLPKATASKSEVPTPIAGTLSGYDDMEVGYPGNRFPRSASRQDRSMWRWRRRRWRWRLDLRSRCKCWLVEAGSLSRRFRSALRWRLPPGTSSWWQLVTSGLAMTLGRVGRRYG